MLLFFVASVANGGHVRNLPTSSKDMPVISLMTGRSTVLRFPSPPKKVVVGNQNYFNIEFIDSDVTIQPLGVSSSNLFVYGEGFTYGFLLKVGQSQQYDDLVFIKSAYAKDIEVVNEIEPKKTAMLKPKLSKPPLKFVLRRLQKAPFVVEGSHLAWNQRSQLYIGDFVIKNPDRSISVGGGFRIDLTQNKKGLLSLPPIFDCETIEPRSACRVRLFVVVPNRTSAELRVSLEKKEFIFEMKWTN
ncbi:MAG: hypothetical protein K2X47_16115 [Bdellovibrionales bacterium]|nr:hypothetical protein [Bdellovibrionales bacterium]